MEHISTISQIVQHYLDTLESGAEEGRSPAELEWYRFHRSSIRAGSQRRGVEATLQYPQLEFQT